MKNKINKAAHLKYSEIQIGSVFQFEKKISRQDVRDFSRLAGDFNPLHVNGEFGKKSFFKNNIVHGMLAGIFFSRLIGMHCPGEKSLYMSQVLNFKLPLFCGDVVTVRGTVTNKNDSIKIITIMTEILKESKIAIAGEARVKVLDDE